MIDAMFGLSPSVRYVADDDGGELRSESKANTAGASDSESDKYEELLVNLTLLKLASQRGNIDCGGLQHVLVRYSNFYQFVLPTQNSHVSVCIEPDVDPVDIGSRVKALLERARD